MDWIYIFTHLAFLVIGLLIGLSKEDFPSLNYITIKCYICSRRLVKREIEDNVNEGSTLSDLMCCNECSHRISKEVDNES